MNSAWQNWNLGGNVMVKGMTDRSGRSFVWFPDGATLEGYPAFAIYRQEDQEWIDPVVFIHCETIERATELVSEYRKGER